MSLEETFRNYTKGAFDMEGRQFVKILKDCKVLDNKFTQVDADLLFRKLKPKTSTKLPFSEFDKALKEIAEKKKTTYDLLVQKIIDGGLEGPILYGTKAQNVPLYDDKSKYTGVCKAGGGTTVDAGRVQYSDLSQLTDRSACNIRGVTTKVLAAKTGESK